MTAPSPYAPLSARQFRLLFLQPGLPSSPLCCRLEEHRLDDTLDYEALSYVWGPREPSRFIKCNDQDMEISPNLYDALLRLRPLQDAHHALESSPDAAKSTNRRSERLFKAKPKKITDRPCPPNVPRSCASFASIRTHQSRLSTRERVVWIDALCINQQDDAEKSHQVQMMRQIYSRAKDVVIWLGESDANVSSALEIINTCLQIGAKKLEPATDTDTPVTYFARRKVNLDALLPPDSEQWDSFMHLYENTWFSRVWVIQESVLASSATVYIGVYELSWVAIGKTAIWASGALFNTDFDQVRLCTRNAAFIFTYFRRRGSHLYPLADLLNFTSGFSATQPVDQIYALLGIVDDQGIVVDYSLPIARVYTQVARHLLQRQPDLEVLSMVHHTVSGDGSIEEFPSWVPRWHERDEYPGIIFNQSPKSDAYAAASSVSIQFSPDGPEDLISIKGLVFDDVKKCGPVIEDFDIGPDCFETNDIFQSGEIIDPFLLPDAKKYRTDEERKMALLKTLTAGLNVEFEPAQSDPDYISSAQVFFDIFFGNPRKSKRPQRKSVLQTIRRSKELGFIPDFEENDLVRKYYDAVVNACSMHRLFVTKEGYIGLGPSSMRCDDVVAILFGGKVPLVLRKEGRQWNLVGECYLHGVMSGEAIEAWRVKDFESIWFEIK
jgi:hypothetical protein